MEVPESLREAVVAGTEESRAAVARAESLCCNGKRPFPFQIEGIKALALHDRFFLADDMGLGKTLTAIVALPDNERVLVICPATLKYNWRDEIQLWRPSYRVTICSGKEETVAKAIAEGKKTKAIPFKIPEPGEIIICNYDILPNYLSPTKDSGKVSKKGKPILVANLTAEQEKALSETTVIGDEFHLVKNFKTARAQKVGQVTRISKRVWALSGTPLMNRPEDLFGVLSAGNMNVFGSWDNFLRLFNGYKNQWGGYEFGGPLPEVPERMQRVMLRRLKSEVMKDLPPKVYQDIEVDCDGTLTKKLDTFLGKIINKGKRDHLRPVDYDNFDEDFDAEELPEFSEFSEIRAMLAESRIPAMLEVVESYEDSGTPLVVFSAHKKPIEALKDRAGWGIITGDTEAEERRNIVREFQEGRLKGVALTIKTGGVGITLTRATNALFVDLDWTPSWNIQAEDRLVRIGATGSHVLIMRMRSSHPLDRHIQKLLAHKIALAYKALEASIKFKPPPPRMPGVAVIEETDDEMMARINAAGEEVEREMALGRLHGVLARESAKVNNVPEPELTPGRMAMLRDALEYMISVCDGAETRDQMGFNKPDAFMSRWIGMCLREEDEVSYRVLERILVRYRRQLKGRFEEIWKPAHEGK
jgi:SWI/SNF-related matrix-associated actin-dependent regulator 1 of chromatin subfamily A